MTPPPAAAASPARPRQAPDPGRTPRSKATTTRRRSVATSDLPRRVSGPMRGRTGRLRANGGSVRRRAGRADSVALSLIAALKFLSPSALTERAIGLGSLRSAIRLLAERAWIALVAFALIGIVTLQLGMLKLNGGIGRALEHEALLQRENATLSIENSELAAGDHVELGAARIGMQRVPTGALQFLVARPRLDLVRATAALRAPRPLRRPVPAKR